MDYTTANFLSRFLIDLPFGVVAVVAVVAVAALTAFCHFDGERPPVRLPSLCLSVCLHCTRLS